MELPVLSRDETVGMMAGAGFNEVYVRSAYDLGEPGEDVRGVVSLARAG